MYLNERREKENLYSQTLDPQKRMCVVEKEEEKLVVMVVGGTSWRSGEEKGGRGGYQTNIF